YTPLPDEQHLFTSPPRIGISITTPSHYPGKQQQPFSISHNGGVLYLTNRRIIYLPDKKTEKLESFAAPLLNLHDSHVSAPFFGPNVWTAALQPVQGGGLPIPPRGAVELKFTFRDGGAFDFHTKFEQVKERLQQAMEAQRMNADGSTSMAAAGANTVDASNVNLEDLPAYQEESDGPLMSPVVIPVPVPVQPSEQRSSGGVVENRRRPEPATDVPDEPPPGYEEAQMQRVQEEMGRRAE
ncbi:hypothetical protein EJ03DRAFT_242318, partial [Teratosphaeria nubilosa]